MTWLKQFASRFAALFRKRKLERELDDELRAHLEMATEENVKRGMPREDARFAALREFGGVEQTKETYRRKRGLPMIETFWQDVRYGARVLAKSPGFTTVAILTLALGIGANSAIFSLIDAVLFKMLPVQDPQQLVVLNWSSHAWPEGFVNSLQVNIYENCRGKCPSFSYPFFERARLGSRAFSSVTGMATNSSKLNVGYKGVPGRADGQLVDGAFFATLGVGPAVGRALTPQDDEAGAFPAAVISYSYWERRFGREPGVVGQTMVVNGVPVTVVGVSAPEFYGVQPGRSVDVWLPLHLGPRVEQGWWQDFGADKMWWVTVLGRLKPGVGEKEAKAELEVLLQQSLSPDVKPATRREAIPHLGTEPLSKGLRYLRAEFSKPLFILMAVVGVVLLAACANLANLLLARAVARQKEIAVRLAMGASRGRLIRQLVTESLLLAAAGGVSGTVLALWGARLLVAIMSSGRNPITLSTAPDPRVLGFTFAVSALTGALFGLAPALRGTRVDLTPALKESAGARLGARRGRPGARLGLDKTLVVAQVSLSLVLLVGAGLFVRTLLSLQHLNAGFNERHLLLFGIDSAQDGYQGQRLTDFYLELQRRLAALPDVRSVSMSEHTLVGGTRDANLINVPGYRTGSGQRSESVHVPTNWVGPGFFETVGIPLLLGRTFSESDREGAPEVAVVNETFVREFLGEGNPIGRRFGFGGRGAKACIEIVGVVGDAKFTSLRSEVPPTIYAPLLQNTGMFGFGMHFDLRTTGDPAQMAYSVDRVIQDLDRNLAPYDVRSEEEQISQSLLQERLFSQLTSFFGGLTVLLAGVGIYGIMAFSVTRRRHEFGIRMALGAQRDDVLRMVIRDGMFMAGAGMAVGIGGALALTRLIASQLFGVSAHDPFTFVTVALFLLAVALAACYVPARRATKVDPMVALRHE